MDQAVKVFERFKSGDEWGKVVTEFGKSSVYKGVELFLTWVGPRISEQQANISEIEGKIANLNDETSRLDSETASKTAVNVKLEEKRQQVTTECEKLSAQELTARKRLEEIESGLAILEERGITRKVVEAIASTDVTSAIELIERINTAKKHEAEKVNHDALKKTNASLGDENVTLIERRDTLEREIVSEQNILDEFKRETAIWRDAQTVVLHVFRRGYGMETLIGLMRGLERFEIKGQPKTSVNRLLNGLGTVKEAEERESRNRAMDAELVQTKKDLADARGLLAATVNSFIPTLNGALTSAKNEISAFRKAAIVDLNGLANSQKSSLATLEADAEIKLNKMNGVVNFQASQTNERMGTLFATLSIAFEVYRDEIKKWGQIKEEMGQNAATLRLGLYFQSLLNNPSLAGGMPTDIAMLLPEWLHAWISKNLSEKITQPPPHVARLERSLPSYSGVKFTSLTEWIRCDLTDRRRRGEIK